MVDGYGGYRCGELGCRAIFILSVVPVGEGVAGVWGVHNDFTGVRAGFRFRGGVPFGVCVQLPEPIGLV